ncbi:MAG: putative manganese transporter, partial [Bacteroidales bacterium]|nr:putative manganese transporter [Bacteroidales bacterium]
LVVVALSSEHFLQSHLWEHVIKHHFLSVFLWTFGVLAFLKVLYLFVDVNTLITDNRWALWGLMLLAIFIGIIPESGPHLIFVVMFFSGAIPFSILLVSSIVQDGHGALPLLAQSRKNFFLMKGLNMAVGLIVGVLGLLLGF